jgi:hypothetical protein
MGRPLYFSSLAVLLDGQRALFDKHVEHAVKIWRVAQAVAGRLVAAREARAGAEVCPSRGPTE